MGGRKARDERLAVRGELEMHVAPIGRRASAAYEVAGRQAIDEPNGAVVPDAEPLGEHADGDLDRFRERREREQRLMLLRRHARFTRGLRAERDEATQGEAKISERGDAGVGDHGR